MNKVASLIRLELFKAWKRPLTWVIVGLGVVSVVGTLVGAYNLMLNNNLYSASTDQVIALEDGIADFILPGALPSALGIARTIHM